MDLVALFLVFERDVISGISLASMCCVWAMVLFNGLIIAKVVIY